MTEIPIHTTPAILALAIHGAASMGITLDSAIISSPDILSTKLSAKLAAIVAARKAAKIARFASASRTQTPPTPQPEPQAAPPSDEEALAAMRALRKQLKQS